MVEITLPPLPWSLDALEPHISRRTLELHHGRHHRAYVDKANALLAQSDVAATDLAGVVRATARDPRAAALYRNAAQAYNHERYWESLSPDGGAPSEALERRIGQDFGTLDALLQKLRDKAEKHFASGWASLVWTGEKLDVVDTHDADTPILQGHAPLLTIDVWEHAYYLDVQNERPKYLERVMTHLLDWRGASARFARVI